ncbi:MAG: shikimate kinase [Tepidisphaeraceae bacterium]|jgi:shikimate kinase
MGVVLIGYRGSGKTTVGRSLAARLGRGFVDCDDLIVLAAGKSIREIFAEYGEEGFRDLETQAVREAAGKADHVIAVGGGALGRRENREIIAAGGHAVIYLRCHAPELLRRIQSDPASATARPALTQLGGGLDEIEKLLALREPIWKEAMHAELDVTGLSVEQAVSEIERLLSQEAAGRLPRKV